MPNIPVGVEVRDAARDIQSRCSEGYERVIFGGYGNCMAAKISGIEDAAELFEKLKMEEAARICKDLAGELRGIL